MDSSTLHAVLTHPAVKAGVAAAISALAVDWQAFRAWKSWKDAAAYQWGTAVFRAVQGFAIGVIGYAGISGMIG